MFAVLVSISYLLYMCPYKSQAFPANTFRKRVLSST